MEENEKKEEKTQNFKTVPNAITYKEPKVKVGFGKSVLLPFFSGVIGCSVVLRNLLWYSVYSFSNIN